MLNFSCCFFGASAPREAVPPAPVMGQPNGLFCPIGGNLMLSPVVGPDNRSYDHGNVMRWLESNACLPGSTIRVPNDWPWRPDAPLRRAIDAYRADIHGMLATPQASSVPAPKPPARKPAAVSSVGSYSAGLVYFFVKNLTGKNLSFVMSLDATIGELAVAVQRRDGIAAHQQRILFSGKQLPFEDTLHDCGVTNNSFLHLVSRLRGD